MQRFRKIVFWAAIIIIVLLLILPFVMKKLHFEFTSDADGAVFESIRFLGIPVAIMLTLTGTVKPGDTMANIIGGFDLFVKIQKKPFKIQTK